MDALDHDRSQECRWKNFDWWRGELGAVYGRPPSPFPASFETPRDHRKKSDGRGEKGDEDEMFDDDHSKLSWPGCQPHSTCILDQSDAKDRYLRQRVKKIRMPSKRPAWIPPSNHSKTGAIFHPPPYTNRCKETRFKTNNAQPMKLTLVPKLSI